MTNPSPETPGKNWHKEIGSVAPEKQQTRIKFYKQFLKRRLGVREEIDDSILKGGNYGLKTLDELLAAENATKAKNIEPFTRNINPEAKKFEKGKGWTLYECLNNYFKNNIGIADKATREREVALSLHYLSRQKDRKGQQFNVDLLRAEWKVEIKDGKLNVYNKQGKPVIENLYIRQPKDWTMPPEARGTIEE